MDFLTQLYNQLKLDEGYRNKLYHDSEGIPTIGIGCNLRDNGLCDAAIYQQFLHDVSLAQGICFRLFPNFNDLSQNRKVALVDMAFNLEHRLEGFPHFINAVNTSDWPQAKEEMLDSKWAEQVGERATRLSDLILNG